MALIAVDAAEAGDAFRRCARLEAGDILYFPQTPIALPAGDLDFLLARQQTGSALHKNIAYKPQGNGKPGSITGLEGADAEAGERMLAIMQRYSQAVESFLRDLLAPYAGQWRMDYASFRPQEEQGRDLPLRRRNDLLHTDAFPTRPTGGSRILRFFNNLNPSKTRDWVVSDPFAVWIRQFTPERIPPPKPYGPVRRAFGSLARASVVGKAAPSLKRSPYDAFMMRLHNALKENASFQESCRKYPLQFAPGSSWMVYTDMVPHAVLSGQYALEQTFLVDRQAMVRPEDSPLSVLEALTRAALV